MRSIKLFRNETDFETFNLNDGEFVEFLKENAHLIIDGYRIYDTSASNSTDITRDHERLASATEIVILRPALGFTIPLWALVAGSLVVSAVATKLLTPKIEAPTTSNRSQGSSTNSFGNRENNQRIGQRVEDVWGKVSGLSPSLIQVPYYVYENDEQVENFAMACMGKGLIENVKDGDTSLSSINSAKFNSWNPSSVLSGTPDFAVGGLINLPINSITVSDGFQSQELLPPNDLDIGGNPDWSISSTGSSAVITLTNYAQLSLDLNDQFKVGSNTKLLGCEAITSSMLKTYYVTDSSGTALTPELTIVLSRMSINGSYTVTGVTSSTVTITVPSWPSFPIAPLITSLQLATGSTGQNEFLETTYLNNNFVIYEDQSQTIPLVYNGMGAQFSPIVGSSFDQTVGPIRVKSGTSRILINLVAQNGYYDIVHGSDSSITANIEVTQQELDSSGNPTANSRVFNFDFSTNTISKTKQAALTFKIDNTSSGAIVYQESQISIKRTTNRNKADYVQNVDKVNFENLYFEEYVPYPDNSDLTIMQAQVISNPTARSVKNRIINLDWTRIIKPFIGSGNFGDESPISTWAETLIAMALDKYNGRLSLANIDADTLLNVQAEIVAYYGNYKAKEIGYAFDSTKIRFQEAYKLLCDAVNVKAYSQGGVFKAYADINRLTSSKQFTHRYKIYGSDTKSRTYETEFDGVELTYRSNLDGKFKSIVLHKNGINSYNRKNIELSGCVNNEVATIRAKRELNIMKNQKYTYSFDADGIARLCVLGERVDSVDYTRIVKRDDNTNNYKIYSGFAVDQSGLTVRLSEPVYFEEWQPHSIRFSSTKGDLLESISCTAGPDAYHVTLSQAPSVPLYIGYQKERSAFTFASDSERASLPVIIRSIKSKDAGGVKAKSITAIDYNAAYYADDKTFSGV